MQASPVNNHDNSLFSESLEQLLINADLLDLNILGSYLTLDSGFDSELNKLSIRSVGLIPVIKPNLRGLKDRERRYAILDEFELVQDIYDERYKIERCFAWQDTYRKLVTRYEKLQSTFMGFRYLAYSMINFRWFLGKD